MVKGYEDWSAHAIDFLLLLVVWGVETEMVQIFL